MVRLYVKNWRCIEEVEITLAPITVFIGKNSSGKSSLAYAAYFLTKIVEWRDTNKVLMYLYGTQLDNVVRKCGDERFYPLVIEAEESRFEAYSVNDVRVPESSPWTTGYLLPSQRIAFFKLSQFIPKLSREFVKGFPEARISLMFMLALFESLKAMPVLPPMYLFLEDLTKLYSGKGFLEHYKLEDLGTIVGDITLFSSLITYEYVDPFVKELKLPLDLAPDGPIDSVIIRMFVDKAQENSLLVIEEPENYKNPVRLIELTKYIAEKTVRKKLTVVITTHNDIVVQTLAKAVEEERIKPSDVAIYYFNRDPKKLWTSVRKLEIYEDGTIEDLPDVEKVLTALF